LNPEAHIFLLLDLLLTVEANSATKNLLILTQ